MKYGVVACPACRTARIIELAFNTFSCQRCGKRHESAGLRKFYATDSDEEARRALGELNVKLSGKIEAYAEFRELQARPEPTGLEARKGEAARVDSIIERLRGEATELDDERIATLLAAEGVPSSRVSAYVERLVVAGVLYEPSPGKYRFV